MLLAGSAVWPSLNAELPTQPGVGVRYDLCRSGVGGNSRGKYLHCCVLGQKAHTDRGENNFTLSLGFASLRHT